MGEPKPALPPQSNGGVKQKPTSLNLTSSTAFYLNFNGRANLNDRHLQQITTGVGGRVSGRLQSASPKLSINETTFNQLSTHSKINSIPTQPPLSTLPSWNDSSELEDLDSTPPPPPAPSHSTTSIRSNILNEQQQHNNLQSPAINQLPFRSPSLNGFSLYTPPAPIPASSTNKVRSTPNGLSQPTARRPHSIAAPPYNLANLHAISQFAGRATASSTTSTTPNTQSWGSNSSVTPTSAGSILQRRSHSTSSTPISLSNGQQESFPSDVNMGTTTRNTVPPQSLWNGQLQQHISRRPHSIASTPVGTSNNLPPTGSMPPTPRTPGEPIQWGASGMVLHQPVPRRAYASTLPHPQPPTPTSQGPNLTTLTNPGNCNTWTPGSSLRQRPHSIASTPQGAPLPPASPSDSGYRSLPSASSDYQLLKSPSQTLQHNQQQSQQQSQSAVRRLSLPSAQTLLRTNGPRPSPTFHGQPFRPFTCGVSPNGNPIFLGCTHLHGSNSTGNVVGSGKPSTPITSPANALSTSQAIQQLLAQPRNGFKIVDDKVSLFIEILDTQERFAKVSAQFFIYLFSFG